MEKITLDVVGDPNAWKALQTIGGPKVVRKMMKTQLPIPSNPLDQDGRGNLRPVLLFAVLHLRIIFTCSRASGLQVLC